MLQKLFNLFELKWVKTMILKLIYFYFKMHDFSLLLPGISGLRNTRNSKRPLIEGLVGVWPTFLILTLGKWKPQKRTR